MTGEMFWPGRQVQFSAFWLGGTRAMSGRLMALFHPPLFQKSNCGPPAQAKPGHKVTPS